MMSGRKRPARHDISDPMHWNKEQYIYHLKEMGMSVKSTWRLDMIRQLYFENYKNTPQSEGEVPQDTININDNTSTEPSKEQNVMETQVQQTNQNGGATHTEELLKETTCALKTATEALSSMSSMVAGILQNKGATGSTSNQKSNFDLSTDFQATYRTATPLNPSNVEQTFRRQVDTSKGIVYSEDLPTLDYVSPTFRKQILEGKDIHLALLLYPKNEVPQTRTIFSEGLTVKRIRTSLGYNSDLHSGHSFRIGASTTAGSKLEDHLIQTHGRWSSLCYTRYIRTSMSTIKQAQKALLD
jgi:hypothetical protein